MKQLTSILSALVVISMATAGCGYYPATISSSRDISWTSRTEYMVVVVALPLKDWPSLQKFSGLEHFRVSQETPGDISDEHVEALSKLDLSKLRQVSLAHCRKVTDKGLQALT